LCTRLRSRRLLISFVQGFLATLTLDTNDVTLFVTDVTLDESKTSLDKSVMDGSGDTVSIPGKKAGTLSLNGHIDQVNLTLLEESWAKQASVPFVLTVAEGLLTSDASWAGNIVLDAFSKTTAADGNWAFSLSGNTDTVVFTPHVPE